MSWDAHINKVCIKLSKFIGIVSRHKYILPTKTKLDFYYAFFFSYLGYCYLVWGNTTVSNLQKLFLQQKKMLRVITNACYDAPTRPIRIRYKIIPVPRLFDYRFACFYKKQTARDDPFLSRIVQLVPHNTPYTTRNAEMFSVPRCRTNYGFAMLKYILPRCLNSSLYNNINTMSFRALRETFID
ncbi:uncharacterized protein LOC144096804 [Amblyomma americanum]